MFVSYKNTATTASKILKAVLDNDLRPVFDIDGVLLDATHRCKFDNGVLDLDHYRKFSTPELISQDKSLPLLKVVHDLNALGIDYDICTARVLCEPNFKMLASKGIKPVNFLSRDGNTDNRRDHVLKRDKLCETFSARQLLDVMLIDDVKDNVETAALLGCWTVHIDYALISKVAEPLLDIRPLLA